MGLPTDMPIIIKMVEGFIGTVVYPPGYQGPMIEVHEYVSPGEDGSTPIDSDLLEKDQDGRLFERIGWPVVKEGP